MKYISVALLALSLLISQITLAQSLGDPLVKITFGSGIPVRSGALAADSGATTYTYNANGQVDENQYTITNLVNNNIHGSFVTSTDHTGNPGGYMMVVNGSLTAGTVYTRTVTGLCGNTQYQFGVWIKNILATNGIPPNMVFHIYAADGVTELGTGVSTGDVPTGNIWHNYTANFTLPPGTPTVVIKLVSNANGLVGNDFAVDDITFSPYGSTVSAIFGESTNASATTCAGSNQTYTIRATSTLASGYVQKLQMYINGVWTDQGPASTATSFSITSPTTAGTYQYRLVSALTDNVSSANCVVASNDLTLTVTPSPVAVFAVPGAICLGTILQFTDASTTNGSVITSWTWDFGDGQTSNLQHPTHTYTAAGSYPVKLTVASATGCQPSTTTHTVTISPLPVADFSFSTPTCLTQAITFTDQSLPGTGATGVSWTWSYGDGTTDIKNTGAAFQHTYTSADTYTVKLTVVNSNGCTASVTKNITVSPFPVAAFTMPAVCLADASATFTDNSTLAGNPPTGFTYLWNFGDPNATPANPNTSALKNPSHKYTQAAIYVVSLIVTSADGCTASTTQRFTVNGSVPQASFTVANNTQLCSDQAVVFTNTSTVNFGNITRIDWYYDNANDPTAVVTDLSPAYGKQYTHNYPVFHTPVSQNYQIHMVAYSGGTCVSVTDQPITLLAVPDLTFTAPPSVCLNGGTIQLNAQENSGLEGAGSYTGPGVSATGLFNPAITGTGTFTVNYTFTSTTGCPVTVSQNIKVTPVPTLNTGPDLTVLSGGSAVLPATASGNGLTYFWTPDTYLSNPRILNPVVSPLQDIIYTLTATNSDGCSVTGQVKVSVLQGPVVPNTFSPNGDNINDVWEIQYLSSYKDCTVEIFNRYGTKLFSSVGYAVPWDGNFNGSQVPVGVYYYLIDPKHGRPRLSGWVMVMR